MKSVALSQEVAENMIGRLCMTTFVGLMALGASCDDRGSFDVRTMTVNMSTVAHCIDPRRIDLKRGLDETCGTIASLLGFGKKSNASSSSGGFFGGSALAAAPAATPTYRAQPQYTAPAAQQGPGAKVIHLN